MKTIADKQILVAADISGVPLKEVVVEHLKAKGWTVTDIGVQSTDDKHPEMFHRIGLKVGAKIAEREFERAIIFCGSGMGIHIAASKCPHVHCAVCDDVIQTLRAVTGNNCNVLAMGAQFVAPHNAIQMADTFLQHHLGDGCESWEGFYDFFKFAYDELDNFDYEEFKKNGFEFKDDISLGMGTEPLEYSIKLKY